VKSMLSEDRQVVLARIYDSASYLSISFEASCAKRRDFRRNNRKAKYQGADGLFPYVRVVAANGAVYSKADQFIAQIEKKLSQDKERANQQRANFVGNESRPMRRTIEHFRSNPVYGGDGTRIDMAYAIYALSHGASEEQVRAVIRSRDLSHKGNEKRQDEYVERTINKALAAVEKSGVALER